MSFVFWLGQALDFAGFEAVPARDTRAADELIRDHKIRVDIVIIDPNLPHGRTFLSCLRQLRPDLKVVAALAARSRDRVPAPPFDAVLRKPDHLGPEAQKEWLEAIRKLERGDAAGRHG